ncbi:EAL domain-containing protein [Rhodanobacter sp. 7MK24]|uniref:EAL domain-containing protein n=1 Tax=Rhodanobacter sp. 7MK24 TaxID=2775922 RepID=UPI00177FAE4A|nr:EAL domain-containing protein [Rhodanobacter sp. 7MK24]MBD8880222.1 EAL domain-containing protein [Rhodanobacter sp. 7MK24]
MPVSPTRIRVVAPGSYSPYLFRNTDGQVSGYVADRWRLFEKHTGIHVELDLIDWNAAKQDVLTGSADAIDMIYHTDAREAQFDFSAPYVTLPLGIYVGSSDTTLHDTASLRGLTVNVGRGSACAKTLAGLGFADLRQFDEYQDAVTAAIRTEPHIFCMDEYRAYYYLSKVGAQRLFNRAFVLDTGHFHVAVRKGNTAMLQVIERGMASITPAENSALDERWLQKSPPLSPYGRIAAVALAVALTLGMLMLAWIWALRRSVATRTRELQAGEAKLRALFDANPDAMWMKDLQGVYRVCNDRVFELLHMERKELVGHTDVGLFPPAKAAEVREMDARAIRRGTQDTYVLSTEGGDGERLQLEVINVPLCDADGTAYATLGVARDVTERKRAEAELRLAAVAFESQDALLVMDVDHIIQRINRAFTALTGHAPEALIGRPVNLLRSRYHDAAFYDQLWAQVGHSGAWHGELWLQAAQGEPKAARMTVSHVIDTDGNVSHYVCSIVDLTREREAYASVDHMTYFDPLTDLPNRYFLHARLQHLLESAGNGGVLLLADLDHFKRINDLRGHAAGDRLLIMIAQRLRHGLDEHRALSRFSGGTFALLETCADGEAMSPARAAECAENLRQALHEPFLLDGTPVVVTLSIGWTVLVPHQGTSESVLKEAELAMYHAKAAGRDQVCCYEPAMQDELAQYEALVVDLRQAVAVGALELHYQPQVNRLGDIMGAEALLRWTRPDGTRIAPAVFIPIAEENGLILPLGSWVLRQACAQLVAWAGDTRRGGLSLAVNVSARQFAQADFVDDVRTALAITGADPTRLKLEVTETAILDDLDDSAAKLAQLRALGIHAALDDFGTGYSSLAYLSRLPLDQLKIDQSFVARLPADPNDAMVAQTIIAMGHGLGMEVIAEGVETDAQRQFLLAQGCDAFQGFLISRPLPLAAFEALLA